MMTAANVRSLTEGEKEVAGKVETFIDQTITEALAKEANRRTFTIKKADIHAAAGVDSLTDRIRQRVLVQGYAKKGGFALSENQHVITLGVPEKKRGGRPRNTQPVATIQPPVAPTTAPESVPTTEPVNAESPAQPVTG